MKIPVNLASQPYENLRPLYLAAGLALAIAVGLASFVVWKDWQNREETRTVTEQIRQLQHESAVLQQEQQQLERSLRTPEVQQISDRAAFLNSLILRKSLSWTQLFMELEKILPNQARITAIRPRLNQSQQAELSLTVAAVEMGPLVEFLKNLESSSRFGSPVVEAQRFPPERTTDRSIFLDLSASYFPSAAAGDSPSPEPKTPPEVVDAAALKKSPPVRK
ncbi:MAG: hypothetical protein A3H27_08440 [Acidobacteria bacterium RIFCSPLOWO2_02_FULL_59_13]|nr:MAG: hypothetical protein A3H27_08440 [Acidobacteria bacterium RIFCSPLOWO2_02_FULL_59_13]